MRETLGIAGVLVLVILPLGCSLLGNHAAQEAKSTQGQQGTAGGQLRQEETVHTDQRQQQQSESAAVAPVARDVESLAVKATASYHDLGQRRLELEQQDTAQRWRYYAAGALSFVGLLICFSADNIVRRSPSHERSGGFYVFVIQMVALAIIFIPWVPLLINWRYA